MQTKENSFFFLLSKWLEKISVFLGISVFAVMVVAIWLEVFYRYVLVNPLPWTDELAVYGMIWMGYLGVGISIKYNEHPSLEFIAKRMPSFIQKLFNWISNIGVAVFLVVVTIWGFDYAFSSGSYRLSGGLGISMTLPVLSVPIGSLFAIIQFLLRLIKEYPNNSDDTRTFQN